MAKTKFTKQQKKVQEAEDNTKFYLVVALATFALVALMYLIMR